MKPSKFDFTPWNATRFFIPLCLQAMSQSLTYPLVGIVVAHGLHGPKEFAAFAQGLLIMFLLGTFGYGLVTTGMVYAKDRIGYFRFRNVTYLLMALIATLQIALGLPMIAPLVFGKLLGIESPHLVEIARWSMLWGLPAQMGFMLRAIPQVILYNEHETAMANLATILRIVVTAALSPLFYWCGLVGWIWGSVCLTFPVLLEALMMWLLARPYVRQLPLKLKGEAKVTATKIFLFNIPLSLGGFLLTIAIFMLNAIINRTPDGANMQAIHLIAIGVVNPLSFGLLRNQAVAIGFPQKDVTDQRTFFFALVSGVAISLLLFLALIPAVSQWYFGSVQNLQAWQIPLARNALLCAFPFLVFQALRGHAEGLAAHRKRPNAILAGQAVFLGTLVMVMVTLFFFNVPGYLMGVVALTVASAMTFATIRLGLALARLEDEPDFSEAARLNVLPNNVSQRS